MSKGKETACPKIIDVVLVGCGLPKKGMGWYHLTQLLVMQNVNVIGVVEPFFLNPSLCRSPPPSWTEFVSETSAKGIQFVANIDFLDKFQKMTLCLIAGRTSDNPKFFAKCVSNGASAIYLEKPGAPSVEQLEQMKVLADRENVKVYLGYNKNVTPYVRDALQFAKKTSNTFVHFRHNNSYERNELPECFTRNAEGMLKNMAVHELALLVTFFGVTVDSIDSFVVNQDPSMSEKLTLKNVDGEGDVTDFSRMSFEVTTKSGTKASVSADRCGGNVSWASVLNSDGKELKRFEFPGKEFMKRVDDLIKADPDMMPYFFVQSDDYLELKTRVINSLLEGKEAEGVATLAVAIEALKLAEYGTEEASEVL